MRDHTRKPGGGSDKHDSARQEEIDVKVSALEVHMWEEESSNWAEEVSEAGNGTYED